MPQVVKSHMLKTVLVLKLDPLVIDLGFCQGDKPVSGDFINQRFDIGRDPVRTVTVFVFSNFLTMILATYDNNYLGDPNLIPGDRFLLCQPTNL